MTPYILVGVFLWLVTILTVNHKSSRGWSLACLAVLIIFTGLRYEIGYDWLAYEKYFTWLNSSFSWDNYRSNQTVLPVEYLYFVLNVSIKSIGGSFELLLFVISAFNLIVLDRMAIRIDPSSRPFMWMLYLCLALIMVQFNIIRQSLASSFVILALLAACERKRSQTAAYGVAALGFHTSAAMFAPVFFYIHRDIKAKYIVAIMIIGALIFIVGNAFLSGALNAIGSILPGGISEKTDSYATGIAGGNVWGISPLAGVLIIFYTAILYILLRLKRDPYVNVAIMLTLTVLIAHVAFGQVPILWNRIMCVSLPWQLAILWKHFIRSFTPEVRPVAVGVGGLAALLVFALQLTREENVAFVPYHSLAQVWLFNDRGDGRLRSMYAVQQGQIEATQRANQ